MLPCPYAYLVPVRLNSGRIGAEVESSFGPEFQQILDELQAAKTLDAEALAFFALAADLLGRNYRLDDEHYRALLRFRPAAQECRDMIAAVYRIACGRGVATPAIESPVA